MGFKSVVLVMALIACLVAPAFADMPLGPKNIVTKKFPDQNMSGYEITQEVTTGVNTAANDSDLSFRNESLFITSKSTGMSPNAVTKGVRTPVIIGPLAPVAGTWSLTLNDVTTRYLRLTLFQSEDAIYGYGDLTIGGSSAQVNVGGTVLGNVLTMYVIPVGTSNLYRLSLTWTPGRLNGNYIFNAPGVTQPGVVFGNAIPPAAAQQTSQVAQQYGQQTNQYSGQQNNTQGGYTQ